MPSTPRDDASPKNLRKSSLICFAQHRFGRIRLRVRELRLKCRSSETGRGDVYLASSSPARNASDTFQSNSSKSIGWKRKEQHIAPSVRPPFLTPSAFRLQQCCRRYSTQRNPFAK